MRIAQSPSGVAETSYICALNRFRALLVAGKYPPGTLLREQHLARKLNVGRSAVRDVVARLAHEGLLTKIPRRGTMVRSLSIEELHELSEMREMLELFAIRHAIVKMPNDVVDELRELIAQSKRMAESGSMWCD